jgi:SAM-dependent methyltransferase
LIPLLLLPFLAQEVAIQAPYVTTPAEVVRAMIEVARIHKHDVVYDLGCGDGRILIAAARRFGARGVGVDIDPERVREARAKVAAHRLAGRIEIRQGDLFETDIREATVVTIYLLPDANLRLRSKLLKELRPGTRIVSHSFDMGDWKPQMVRTVGGTKVYLWTVPPLG